MVTRPNNRRPSYRATAGVNHQIAYDKALSYELSDLDYVTPKFKKVLELKVIQFRVRYVKKNEIVP